MSWPFTSMQCVRYLANRIRCRCLIAAAKEIPMFGFIRTVLWSSKRLPDAVFTELVDIIFTSLPPVTLIGVILTAVGILVAAKNNDPIIWALSVLSIRVTAGRIALILAYRRRARLEGVQDPAHWDGRYAIGAYSFALVLGAFNLLQCSNLPFRHVDVIAWRAHWLGHQLPAL